MHWPTGVLRRHWGAVEQGVGRCTPAALACRARIGCLSVACAHGQVCGPLTVGLHTSACNKNFAGLSACLSPVLRGAGDGAADCPGAGALRVQHILGRRELGQKKPGYAGEPVGWQKRPFRACCKPGSRPTMKLGSWCNYLVRMSLPSLVACRRYTEPLWLIATAF
jgi:hypothetical protein